jgi:tartronate-semialdehyde synthase
VVLEFIVERVTNISMGTEISGVNEFEEILCLDPSLTLESGWVSMADQAAAPSLQSVTQGNPSQK